MKPIIEPTLVGTEIKPSPRRLQQNNLKRTAPSGKDAAPSAWGPRNLMDTAQLNGLTNFIWNIADVVLRDVDVRGRYRDFIPPTTVLRRLDAVLEPAKQAVLEIKAARDREGVTNQDDALRATQEKLQDDQVHVFSLSASNGERAAVRCRNQRPPNVQDILTNFASFGICPDLPGRDNHSMSTMFEELVRRFSEDNNEATDEHWTPRNAVRLLANLMFLPVATPTFNRNYAVGARPSGRRDVRPVWGGRVFGRSFLLPKWCVAVRVRVTWSGGCGRAFLRPKGRAPVALTAWLRFN